MNRQLNDYGMTAIITAVKSGLLKKRDNVEGIMLKQAYTPRTNNIILIITAYIDGKKAEVIVDKPFSKIKCANTALWTPEMYNIIHEIIEQLLEQDRKNNRRTKEEHILKTASRMKETVIDYNRAKLKGKVRFYTIETEDFFDVYATVDSEHFTIVRKFNKFNSEFLGKRFTPDEVDEYIDSDDAYYDVLEMLE